MREYTPDESAEPSKCEAESFAKAGKLSGVRALPQHKKKSSGVHNVAVCRDAGVIHTLCLYCRQT